MIITDRFTGAVLCGGRPLNDVLEDHKKWLKGQGGQRAELLNANLASVYLPAANLRKADLRGAVMAACYFGYGKFQGADFTGAVLAGASLIFADFTDAVLKDVNFAYANLACAKIPEMINCETEHANLSGCENL